MKNKRKNVSMKQYILKKFEDESFLKSIYEELFKIYDKEEEIENLSEQDLYNIIIKENLISKIDP